MAKYSPFLSKSLYIKGLQCHKALWLHKNRPELKDDVSTAQQAVFDAGTDVGILAQHLFPGGVEVPYDGLSTAQQVTMTRRLIDEGVETIYEAAFNFDNIFCKVDILHKGVNGWGLYEVKNSTDKKDVYVNDIAVQYLIVTGSEIPVSSACLVHINNQYVRHGDIDVPQLFTILDVTEEIVAKQAELHENIAAMRSMLQGEMPAIDIGPHCSNPYECSFSGYCWSHIPSPSVFDFADLGKPDGFALYKQGIVKMEDVSRETLGWRQQMQLDGCLHQKNVVDVAAIREFLNSLWYPLAFLDFETTCLMAVPLFDGTRPFQPVPFQFSLHLQNTSGAPIQHREFLAPAVGDPQEPFLHALLDVLPENACILSWNKGFEGKILRMLAERFPMHSERLHHLIDNLVDLMAPFRSKQIYHWKFDGSYSIKVVLPALVPELSYETLSISDGGTAADAWLRLRASSDPEEQKQIRGNLLEYCHLDTLAMVRILDELGKM